METSVRVKSDCKTLSFGRLDYCTYKRFAASGPWFEPKGDRGRYGNRRAEASFQPPYILHESHPHLTLQIQVILLLLRLSLKLPLPSFIIPHFLFRTIFISPFLFKTPLNRNLQVLLYTYTFVIF